MEALSKINAKWLLSFHHLVSSNSVILIVMNGGRGVVYRQAQYQSRFTYRI